jgi:NADH/NAD ratio-sensing transcriptional regulator Rex
MTYGEYVTTRKKLIKELKHFNKKELKNKVVYVSSDFYDMLIKALVYYSFYKDRGVKFIVDYDMNKCEYGFSRKDKIIETINDLII